MHLEGRRLEIALGHTGLPLEKVRAYRRLFSEQGYSLPPLIKYKPGHEPWPVETPETQAEIVNTDCRHRIAILAQEPCACGASKTIDVFGCSLHKRCAVTERDRKRFKDPDLRSLIRSCEACPDRQGAEPAKPRHPIAKHVTKFACGITSAPRPKPTLARCVRSVIAAGFEPTVFAEPGTDLSGVTCPVVQRPQRLGCFYNYLRTLRDLLEAHPDAEAIVIFQDDVIVARQTREFLEHDLWPSDNCGAVSLYSPDFPSYEHGKPLGFTRQGGKYLMGACAMVYPRKMAEAMITRHTEWRGVAKGPPVKNPVKKKAVDTWIGHAVKGEKLHCYYPNPSLCQHIADTSALGHGGNDQIKKGRRFRRSEKFRGEKVTPFEAFESKQATLRFNGDGSMRLADPLSVVIPAWNCLDLTTNCLTALAKNADVSPLDVIYVDNGSDPGTIEQVEELARSLGLFLRTIALPENRGFCPATNAGMQLALGATVTEPGAVIRSPNPLPFTLTPSSDGYVLLLNNDAYIHPRCLSAMIRHARNGSKVASVGPLTADGGSQSILRNAELKRMKGQRRNFERSMLVGFCQLKTREALRDVGLLDSNLPHGLGTDDDWAARARRKGYKLLLACDAFADHDHKSTFRRSGQDRRAMQIQAVNYLRQKGTWPT